jgi:hypothetical protein
VTGKDLFNALTADASPPDAIVLAGCGTSRDAMVLAGSGTPTIGTTSGVGVGVGTNATVAIVQTLVNGGTPSDAANAGNQYLNAHPVNCTPYACDGEYRAYEYIPAEREQ